LSEEGLSGIEASSGLVFVSADNGLYKSHDQGDTWEKDPFWQGFEFDNLSAENPQADHPYRMFISDDGMTVIAQATFGMYRSTDSGESWHSIFDGVYVDYLDDVALALETIAVSRSNPEIIYAVDLNYDLLRTVDGGENWTVAHEVAAADLIVVDPEDPDHIFLDFSPTRVSFDGGVTVLEEDALFPESVSINDYHVIFGEDDTILVGGLGGMLVSHDSGRSWHRIGQDPIPGPTPDVGIPGFFMPSSFEYEWLAELSDTWWVAGIAVHPMNSNVIAVATKIDGVFLTQDSGAHWASINRGLPKDSRGDFPIAEDIAWSSDGSRLFLATLSGLFVLSE
jgi:hypothetical protein